MAPDIDMVLDTDIEPDNGTWVHLSSSGVPTERSEWRRGKRHGRTTRYRPDGTVCMVEHYERNRRHGVHTRWYANGQIRMQKQYWDGRLVEWHEYFPDGVLAGQETGDVEVWYYHNGARLYECRPVEGEEADHVRRSGVPYISCFGGRIKLERYWDANGVECGECYDPTWDAITEPDTDDEMEVEEDESMGASWVQDSTPVA